MKKVVVVDDEVNIRLLLNDFLSGLGFHVFEAKNGLEGLETIRREQPDLVLLDMMMPQMNGMEVLRRMKKVSPDSITLVLTALEDEATAKEALQLGAYDYLTKPISLTNLENDFLRRIFPDL